MMIPELISGKLYVVEPGAKIVVIPKQERFGAYTLVPGEVFMFVGGRYDEHGPYTNWCYEILYKGRVFFAFHKLAEDIEFLKKGNSDDKSGT